MRPHLFSSLPDPGMANAHLFTNAYSTSCSAKHLALPYAFGTIQSFQQSHESLLCVGYHIVMANIDTSACHISHEYL
jgi:hypothetical protein